MSEPSTAILSEDECWEFLGLHQIGRLATAVGGEPEIFPLNYSVNRRAIYFRTVPGTKLVELVVNSKVAFQVDQWGPDMAYSVVVKGTAEILHTDADLATAHATGLTSYSDTDQDVWVRLTPNEISGRRLHR
jgi:nitroimidazol reductase NimA-like FMN-containing flavoprotein (pyridoxamine 5'-phosphate oxidase superfamily)